MLQVQLQPLPNVAVARCRNTAKSGRKTAEFGGNARLCRKTAWFSPPNRTESQMGVSTARAHRGSCSPIARGAKISLGSSHGGLLPMKSLRTLQRRAQPFQAHGGVVAELWLQVIGDYLLVTEYCTHRRSLMWLYISLKRCTETSKKWTNI